MEINLMMKRGKIIGKAFGNHVFNHHRARPRGHGYGLQDYEFSCNSSPNPVFSHAKRSARHSYFPCISAVVEEVQEGPPMVSFAATTTTLPRLHYSPNNSTVASAEEEEEDDEEEEESEPRSFENNEVDNEAEEFIRKFYEQLRRQRRVALLQYEMDYEKMLTRGH